MSHSTKLIFNKLNNRKMFDNLCKMSRLINLRSLNLHSIFLRSKFNFMDITACTRIISISNTMRKWHSRIRVASPKQRRLSNVLSRINETCSAMCFPKILVETAAMIYRNFENKSGAKGKSINSMAAATIYLACKRCSVVRSLEEIVQATGITLKDRSSLKLASKYYRMMVMEMGVFTEQPSQLITSSSSHYPIISEAVSASESVLLSAAATTTVTSLPIPVTLAIDHYIAKLANMARIEAKVE